MSPAQPGGETLGLVGLVGGWESVYPPSPHLYLPTRLGDGQKADITDRHTADTYPKDLYPQNRYHQGHVPPGQIPAILGGSKLLYSKC